MSQAKSGTPWSVIVLVVLVVIISVYSYFRKDDAGEGKLGFVSSQDFDTRVKDYIIGHPEVIIEALKNYHNTNKENQQQDSSEVIKKSRDRIQNDPASPVFGNKNGDITVTEFFDYHCGYCKQARAAVMQLIKEDPNVRFVFKELPILGPDSEIAAKVALAAHKLDPKKYLDVYSVLMSKDVRGKDEIIAEVVALGYSKSDIEKTMEDKDIIAAINKNRGLASELRIQGTPAFIVGETIIPGAVNYPDLKRIVDQERRKQKSQKSPKPEAK